ncbi:MAG TPA: glycosyltransferase, partial [Candidatus Saccharimonadales bacterium]|nr:glycosyltransferase [Candidatus Saccharimonadales bacterium]
MKICLVHDDFCQSGGAESLFATIAALFPKAPIYTSLVDNTKLPQSISKERVNTSFLQKIPFKRALYKLLLPLYPLAFETFNFDQFDIVFSSTTRFAKSIITKPNTVHICYINSAPRFLWDKEVKEQYAPKIVLLFFSPLFFWLKRWDKAASARPDLFIANSQNVRSRVKKYYNRDSTVIYPFADTNFYDIPKVHNWKLKSQNYFLVVSRLVKWKKIDTAIKACQSAGVNLKIVGSGPDEARLKRITAKGWIPKQVRDDKKGNCEFLGRVTREDLKDLYQNSNGLVVTQEEDFGIATVEAQACGIPVVAYSAGGQQEIVIEGKTGILFKNQTKDSIKDAIEATLKVKWKKSTCRDNALRFS